MRTTGAHTEAPALSVIIPVYNGEKFIAATLRRLGAYLASVEDSVEIIVVDDGSTDGTAVALEAAAEAAPVNVRIVRADTNEGKGAAIVRGMRTARGAERIFVDADLAYPPEEIAKIRSRLQQGADVAVANRAHRQSRLEIPPVYVHYYYFRHVVGRIFNGLVRVLLLPGVADSQAGLKGFRAAAAERLFSGWLPRGFSFDVALLFRARRLGLRIETVPVYFRYESEPTTVRWARDTLRMLRDVVQIRVRLAGDRLERWSTLRRAWLKRGRTGTAAFFASDATLITLLVVGGVALIVLVTARLALENDRVAATAWFALLTTVVLLGVRTDLQRSARPVRCFRSRAEGAAFAAVFVICAALRLVRLGDIPPVMHLDSAACGLLGAQIRQGRVADLFALSDWYYTPYLSFVPYAVSFALSGVSITTLRLPTAILGTLTLIPLYCLVRLWFGARAALLVAALYAVSHAAIHFSRIGLWNIEVLFYEVTAFAALFAGLRRRRRSAIVLAGIVTGLALYSYTGGRLIPVMVLAFLGFELLRRRRVGWALPWYLGAVCVTIAPLVLSYVRQPEAFFSDRASAMWVLGDAARAHVQETLGTTDPAAVLWEQTKRTLGGLVNRGDASTQYGTGQPLLSPATALLTLIGFVLVAWRWREPRYAFVLMWTVLGLLLASVLVLDSPSFTRLVVFFPVPYVLVAVALEALARLCRRRLRLGVALLAVPYLLVVAQSAVFDLSGYYRFTHALSRMPREWDVLQVMERLGNHYDYYMYTGPFLFSDSPIFTLFGDGVRTVSGFSERDLPRRLLHDTAFVLTPEFRDMGVIISERFPGAEREVMDDDGEREIIVYRCTRQNGCRIGQSRKANT